MRRLAKRATEAAQRALPLHRIAGLGRRRGELAARAITARLELRAAGKEVVAQERRETVRERRPVQQAVGERAIAVAGGQQRAQQAQQRAPRALHLGDAVVQPLHRLRHARRLREAIGAVGSTLVVARRLRLPAGL